MRFVSMRGRHSQPGLRAGRQFHLQQLRWRRLGAGTLCFPVGVAVDSHGNLYVSDESDNRVLEFNTPLIDGTTAEMVFGQGGVFTSNGVNNGGVSASSLNGPEEIAADSISGDLYIADTGNNRVLEYNAPLTNSTANTVFGQAGSFTSNSANNGGVGANSLSGPSSVAVDGSG